MVDIKIGDCRDVLKTLPDKSVDCCVTSPPYWGLRDYQTGTWEGGDSDCLHMRTTKISKNTATGHKAMAQQGNVVSDAIYKTKCPKCGAIRKDKQIGLEETPEEYTKNIINVFREVRRVLKDEGTLWLNLGDTYCGTGHKANHIDPKYKGRNGQKHAVNNKILGLKQKDLIGIPWRVAFALQADGWYLRQDIIWHKPNPMPESVQDRCTKAHEYIFLLSKNKNYYYDNEAIKEKATDWGTRDRVNGKYHNEGTGLQPHSGLEKSYETKNKRSVWTVPVKGYKEAHFAVFPTELIEPCIQAGCPKNGTVLDPFGGSGTTALVADRLGRKSTIIELNKNYISIADNRLYQDSPLFVDINHG
jgi:DNA modification methylase|tara:strand:- start:184 stop:1260 length:1077 start_codon:yes stop_codon:yes gene_type:complete